MEALHRPTSYASTLREQNWLANLEGVDAANAAPDPVTFRTAMSRFATGIVVECEVHQEVMGQDHTLFISRVTPCGATDGNPLMFYGSRYHQAALAT